MLGTLIERVKPSVAREPGGEATREETGEAAVERPIRPYPPFRPPSAKGDWERMANSKLRVEAAKPEVLLG